MDGNNFNNEFGGGYADAVYEAPAQQSQGNGFAIASMVLGILGSTCLAAWFVPQVLAIVFSIVAKKKGQSKGMSIAGLVLGIVGLLIFLVIVVIYIVYGAAIFALMYAEM